ncbi:MAG: acetate/propionate family kinase [Pseudomonadota bacterium]
MTASHSRTVLVLNAGSSSLKFAIFTPSDDADGLADLCRGQIDGIGAVPRFKASSPDGAISDKLDLDPVQVSAQPGAMAFLLGWLETHFPGLVGLTVGHRVVHGGVSYSAPVVIDPTVRDALNAFKPLAPLHQPHNLSGIDAAIEAFPDAAQVACFDTAFHRNHPWVNDTFALPRSFYEEGVRRYGFHGLSYEYISDRLKGSWSELAAGRVVVAHLGNGASMCAIKDGISVGSTMGFSALDGLPMGTRCGQIDPGVLLYLMGERGMSADEISNLLYKESGLKGLSGIGHDMRELEASDDPRAAEAIAYFVFRIRRELGAMASVLQGLDGIIFTGGIGENSAHIRSEVLTGTEWLGIEMDKSANAASAEVISTPTSRVKALVLKTNEELMIARHCLRLTEGRAAAAE